MAAVVANVAAVNVNFRKSPAAASMGRDLSMTDKEDAAVGQAVRFVAKNELFDLLLARFLIYMERLGRLNSDGIWKS
jgi:hypothetical protein